LLISQSPLNQYPTTQADGTAKGDCKITVIIQQEEGNTEQQLQFRKTAIFSENLRPFHYHRAAVSFSFL